MDSAKPNYFGYPKNSSLPSNYCNNLEIQQRRKINYEDLIQEPKDSIAFEGQTGCSHMAALPKRLEPPSFHASQGTKLTSYSRVHPKKKLRMAYDKEVADAHSSSSRISRLGKEPQTSISFSGPGRKLQPAVETHGFNREEAGMLSQRRMNFQPYQHKIEPPPHLSVTELPELIPLIRPQSFPPSSILPSRTISFPLTSLGRQPTFECHKHCSSLTQPREFVLDKPQDLRISEREKLKKITKDIFRSGSIPELSYDEIPKIVSTQRPVQDKNVRTAVNKPSLFEEDYRRMSREVPSSHSTHNSQNILSNSSECNGTCSTSYTNPFSPLSTLPNSQRSFPLSATQEFPQEHERWTEVGNYQHLPNNFANSEKHQLAPSEPSPADPEDYLMKAIDTWSYADVIFFLMEACNELRINPGEVKFKNSDNGSVLLQMNPSDFEILAPGHGQELYDYFINFKTQNYMASGQNFQGHYYNYKESEDQCVLLDQPLHSHQQHIPHEEIYPSNHYQQPESLQDISPSFDHFQPSPCNSSGTLDSSMSEYVPQGSHYMEGLSDQMFQRTYEMPSAALKNFPPLHNYDEPLSDPDELEEEAPPDPPKKRGPGRPPKPESERKRKPKKTGRLWEFIRNLLLDPKTCPSLLRWEDAHQGIFRIVQSDIIANKWGMRKNNEKMNYEKLSRAMRYYYKAKIFEPVLGKRLVYKFGSNAKGWRPLNPNNPNFQT